MSKNKIKKTFEHKTARQDVNNYLALFVNKKHIKLKIKKNNKEEAYK